MNLLNPMTWLYGALALALVAGGAYFTGRSDGKKNERVVWQAKEIKANQDAADSLAVATKKVSDAEKSHAIELQHVSNVYQKELIDVSAKKDAVIVALRTGAIRLRDPGTKYTLSPNPLPGTSTGTSRCDGGPGGELSNETAEFLASEASRADAIVKQLAAAQAVIMKDRELK